MKISNKKVIEIEAKTVVEAIQKAKNMMKAHKHDLNIEVLKEENKGLFGMEGANLARIRVTVIPLA